MDGPPAHMNVAGSILAANQLGAGAQPPPLEKGRFVKRISWTMGSVSARNNSLCLCWSVSGLVNDGGGVCLASCSPEFSVTAIP